MVALSHQPNLIAVQKSPELRSPPWLWRFCRAEYAFYLKVTGKIHLEVTGETYLKVTGETRLEIVSSSKKATKSHRTAVTFFRTRKDEPSHARPWWFRVVSLAFYISRFLRWLWGKSHTVPNTHFPVEIGFFCPKILKFCLRILWYRVRCRNNPHFHKKSLPIQKIRSGHY